MTHITLGTDEKDEADDEKSPSLPEGALRPLAYSRVIILPALRTWIKSIEGARLPQMLESTCAFWWSPLRTSRYVRTMSGGALLILLFAAAAGESTS